MSSTGASPAGKRGSSDGEMHHRHHEQEHKRPRAMVAPLLPGASEMVSTHGEHDHYYPQTSIPTRGWLQPCRYCRQWTSGTVNTTAPEPVPVCKRCQSKLAEYFQALLAAKRAQLQQAAALGGPQAEATAADAAATLAMSQAFNSALSDNRADGWTSSTSTSPSTLPLETQLSL